jgi:hypothetical protein
MNWVEGLFYDADGKLTERLAIREPIWNGRKVGIAVFRAKRSEIVEVKLLYRLKNTKTLIPKILWMESSRILQYPHKWASGVELCLVPLADLQERKGAKWNHTERQKQLGL